MKKKGLMLGLGALALSIFFSSCDDHADDAEYRSLPPRFSDLEVKVLDTDDLTLKAGEKLIATGVQKKKGRLLYKAKYSWTATPVNGSHRYRKEVIYDKESFNPTDTLVFENPGTYTLKFKGQYFTSGGYKTINEEVDIDKGKIVYETPSFQYYNVTIEKRITVR